MGVCSAWLRKAGFGWKAAIISKTKLSTQHVPERRCRQQGAAGVRSRLGPQPAGQLPRSCLHREGNAGSAGRLGQDERSAQRPRVAPLLPSVVNASANNLLEMIPIRLAHLFVIWIPVVLSDSIQI